MLMVLGFRSRPTGLMSAFGQGWLPPCKRGVWILHSMLAKSGTSAQAFLCPPQPLLPRCGTSVPWKQGAYVPNVYFKPRLIYNPQKTYALKGVTWNRDVIGAFGQWDSPQKGKEQTSLRRQQRVQGRRVQGG